MVTELLKNFALPKELKIPSHADVSALANSVKTKRHKVWTDGQSVLGNTLFCFAIGTGERVIAVTAGAHSDEPPGLATAYYLTQNLISNSAFAKILQQYTFVIFPMLDVDGAALNYEWAQEPSFDFKSYHLHNYRNINPGIDCEHGIPLLAMQDIRPELAFFKRHIDKFAGRIDYYVTLHTTHVLGGAIFIARQDFSDQVLMSRVQELCKSFNLPLMDYQPRGDDGITYLGKGFLGAPYVSAMQKKYEKHPEILALLKMPTYEYVETKCGGKITMISELPLWIAARMKDCSDVEMSLADVKRHNLSMTKDQLPKMKTAVDELDRLGANQENPWLKNTKFSLRMLEKTMASEEARLQEYAHLKATKVDLVELETRPFIDAIKLHRLYIKCLSEIGGNTELLKHHLTAFEAAVQELENIYELQLVDLRTQVQIQTGMIFQGLIS